MRWMFMLHVLSLMQQAVLSYGLNSNEAIEHKINVDEIDNDFLFNYHRLKERIQKRKRKRELDIDSSNSNKIIETPDHTESTSRSRCHISKRSKNSLPLEQLSVTEGENPHTSAEISKDSLEEDASEKLARPYLSNDLMNVDLSHRGHNVATCDMDQLVTYLAQMQATNPESIVNLASQQDLDSLCDKAVNSLDNIDTYLRTCDLPTEHDLYLQLIKGVRSLSDKVCFDRSFRSEFFKEAPCISQLHSEYQDCVGPTDWVEDPNVTVVCQTYKNIGDCYYAKTMAGCGAESADTMRELLVCIMDSVVPVKCKEVDITKRRSNPPTSNGEREVSGVGELSGVENRSNTTAIHWMFVATLPLLSIALWHSFSTPSPCLIS